MDIERVIDSEMYVLGTCMNENKFMSKVIDTLKENDFYKTKHKMIYRIMVELFQKNINFDASIIMTKLMKEIKSNSITVTEIQLIDSYRSFNAFDSHLLLVKNESRQRAIKEVCKRILANDNDVDVNIDMIQNALLTSTIESEEEKLYTAADMMDLTLKQIEAAYQSESGITGISTGIKSIDNVTNGLQRKEFVIFAARPSMGKTAFSLKLLQEIKGNTLYVQIDMSLQGMGQRMLAANSLIENGKVGRGKLNDEEWERLNIQYGKLASKKNMFFYEPSSTTVAKIRNKAKEVKFKYGLDVIIIDHIGKVNGIGKSEYEKMSSVSKDLKALAKELNCCVIGLTQLNRGCEQRADKRPMISDLRDSGKIEEDADIIGMLYRDGYYRQRQDGEDIKIDILEIDFQKCRNGRLGVVELNYNLETQTLSEFDRHRG